jgi:hypothetical protein
MSYYNQMDHLLLDRMLIRDILLRLSQSRTELILNDGTSDDPLTRLKRFCDSDLEREWLDFVVQRGYRLPDEAQRLFPDCNTRVDFYYQASYKAVEIDGPKHDLPEVIARDRAIEDCFFDRGITVIRFRYDNKERWGSICQEYANVFGAVG